MPPPGACALLQESLVEPVGARTGSFLALWRKKRRALVLVFYPGLTLHINSLCCTSSWENVCRLHVELNNSLFFLGGEHECNADVFLYPAHRCQ